jgi:hypothetical protein
MALGGYQGWDRILTPSQLAQDVANNTVRFFYIPAGRSGLPGSFGGTGSTGVTTPVDGTDATGNLTQWVRTNCTAVPQAQWQSSAATANGYGRGFGGGGQQLYSCASLVKR